MSTNTIILLVAAAGVAFFVMSDRSDRRDAAIQAAAAQGDAAARQAEAQASAIRSQNSLWGAVNTGLGGIFQTISSFNSNGAASSAQQTRTDRSPGAGRTEYVTFN
jgi:hypothetical protein